MFRPRPDRVDPAALLVAALLIVLGGCSQAPEKPPNTRLDQSLQLSRQGHNAYLRGDLAAAIGFYTGALRLDLSIENQYGIFNDRLNLSQAIDAAGDAPAARQQLEILLTDKTFPLGAEQRARAYAGLALLFLKQGETGEAERMIGEARHSCGTACPNLGAILNIQARIELERGNPASALASAGASLPLLADADQLSERANAWRIIGQARLARNETTSAIEGLQQALALDRELGKPERIVDDLMLLGRAYATSGNADRAGDFFRRALSVAEATADPALMKRVGELPGINRPQSSDH